LVKKYWVEGLIDIACDGAVFYFLYDMLQRQNDELNRINSSKKNIKLRNKK
jgi:hypothetical protein